MTEAGIPLAAVIGHPIAHSRSPRLHGYWLRRYGINGHYVPMDVAPENLAEVIGAMRKMGFKGANVTIPHKETVLRLVDTLTDSAKAIGAVNTLVFKDDGTVAGDNTDGYGFIENLQQGAPDWQGDSGSALVLGAGGAARAIVFSLLEAGVPKVMIANRTRDRAEKLREDFGVGVEVIDWSDAESAMAEAATLVNTTALGMTGKAPLTLSLDAISKETVVTDIVYTPLKTDLLRQAEIAGCRTVDGLGMLLHQAVPGFEAWFGKRPEVDADLREEVLR